MTSSPHNLRLLLAQFMLLNLILGLVLSIPGWSQEQDPDEIDLDFLGDVFDEPEEPIHDTNHMWEDSTAHERQNSTQDPDSFHSFGDYQQLESPQLDALVVSLEPQRPVQYHDITVRFTDFDNQLVPQLKTTFLASAFNNNPEVVIFSNNQGELHLLDFPENSYALYRTGGPEIGQGMFMPMNHEIFAPTFSQLDSMGVSEEVSVVNNEVNNNNTQPSPRIIIDHVQIRAATFNYWLNAINLTANPDQGHLCGKITSTLSADASGYEISVVDQLRSLRMSIGRGLTPSLTDQYIYRIYYFNDQEVPDPQLTTTGASGRYCLFNLRAGTYRLNIKPKLADHAHNLSHQVAITPGHISYLNSAANPGKVGLIRYVLAPPAATIMSPEVPVALPLKLVDVNNPETSRPPADTLTVFESELGGISTQSDLTTFVNLSESLPADSAAFGESAVLSTSHPLSNLVRTWLSEWWNDDDHASTLPPSSTLYPQVFAPQPNQTISIIVDDGRWEPALYRVNETIWYGIRPLLLLKRNTLIDLAQAADLFYNPAASHIFVEHRLREEETSSHLTAELWNDDGTFFSHTLVQRSWDIIRLVYYNLNPDRYQWTLKTTDGRWRASQVVYTKSSHISVIESGRHYQLGEGLPFQGTIKPQPSSAEQPAGDGMIIPPGSTHTTAP